jgi:5-oxopent-3-ene-1,2,5-tricarboxylate decarboxylase / 2-hydroxyhepta-2,4-diene-1,7-dioate isomerase
MKHARLVVNGTAQHGILMGNEIVLDDGSRVLESEAQFLSPVQPRQIFATHLTYRSRCVEYEMKKLPDAPAWFIKPLGTVSSHRATVARPKGCEYLNYEGELVVVIGKRCQNVTPEDALSHVLGYTIVNDFGVHDFRHADRGAMVRVKGQDGFAPMGPYLVDAADIDPSTLTLTTYVNGEVAQQTQIGEDLMFNVAYQIADLARLVTLEPGDVLFTGTPAHSRPVQPGDVVAVEISGIGRLENTIIELERDLVPVGIQPEVTAATLHVALAIPEDEAERRVVAARGGGA